MSAANLHVKEEYFGCGSMLDAGIISGQITDLAPLNKYYSIPPSTPLMPLTILAVQTHR
jgi:hypothetical protein